MKIIDVSWPKNSFSSLRQGERSVTPHYLKHFEFICERVEECGVSTNRAVLLIAIISGVGTQLVPRICCCSYWVMLGPWLHVDHTR